MKARIRTSKEEDLWGLYQLALEFCLETGQPYETHAILDSIKVNIAWGALVAEADDRIVGVLSFLDILDPWTHRQERWGNHWFVTKDYRGRVGLELLKAADPKFINLPPNTKAPKGYKIKAIIYEKI